ncbi:MAG TPA: leucyl/phenylalanyl-tRNA--protein transferase [Fimbriimonadaceae bacterium]|nr:leucyl/phenylalanyl-tRNA--protein transferase [Fimbriimonadaceae bacterium]HRJ31999.1 leucyl/phenylalanyl-tRNA--protein transferase [Fimbriimonadaceae bacterium]
MTEMPITPWLIDHGYRQGTFPMGEGPRRVEWFAPYERAVFPLDGFLMSRSLRKTLRQRRFEVRFDTSFEAVMRSCRRPEGNWINEPLIQVYTEIHRQGWGHCSECWRENRLVGGVYGIVIGTVFCAESMFHRETDASKVALWAMIEKCREAGFTIFDAQVMSPHLASLGAVSMSQDEYVRRLQREGPVPLQINPDPSTLVIP